MTCAKCVDKDTEIAYLRGLLSLQSLERDEDIKPSDAISQKDVEHVEIKQRHAILRRQLALIRADVQYMNRHIQSVLGWLSTVISSFLSCCGRLSDATVESVITTASCITGNVSKVSKEYS